MKKRNPWILLLILTIVVCLDICLMQHCKNTARLNQVLTEDTLEMIRAQEVSLPVLEQFYQWETESKEGFSCYDYLCVWLMTGETNQDSLEWYVRELKSGYKDEFAEFTGYLTGVWEDLEYFPIPSSSLNSDAQISFGNSWMALRTFGGQRGHEGTDIMATINERGRYPVISMTDGVVEQIGWLTKGGYRLGIRAPHGGYFYYAHLYDYAKDFQPGDRIEAGELIGFMGDSGYSEIEGTVGNFDVHLHLGIYVNQPDGTEMSINSFWPLKYMEEHKLNYQFY